MKGFQRCDNGHFYKDTLGSCPHCPAGNADMNRTQGPGSGPTEMDKTQVFGAGNATPSSSGLDDKTQVFGGGNNSSGGDDKTQVFGGGASNQDDKTQVFGGSSSSSGGASGNKAPDFSRTFIGGMETTSEGDEGSVKKEAPRASRKITGWIVSFTLDPMGVDYRIFEGNNTIGRDVSNSITITKDSTISSKHANILHKKGKFWIKDEMAANGTFLNGEEIEIEKAYDLVDGDEIRLGDTVFKFKACN